MEFIDIETEQTTAGTNVILAIVAFVASGYLYKIGGEGEWKTLLWVWCFGLLGLAALLGAVGHGLKLSEKFESILWRVFYFPLGLLMPFLTDAVIYDVFGQSISQEYFPIILGFGTLFLGIMLTWPDNFILFIVYEAIVMLFALGGYLWLAWQGSLAGSWLISIGIFLTIVAAGIQANRNLSLKVIWLFNNNGLYHIVQIIGNIFLVVGLRESLLLGA